MVCKDGQYIFTQSEILFLKGLQLKAAQKTQRAEVDKKQGPAAPANPKDAFFKMHFSFHNEPLI